MTTQEKEIKRPSSPLYVLGIESSCDETSAAVVSDTGQVLSNVLQTQIQNHETYGGVVPELSARAHLYHMEGVIQRAMKEAEVTFPDLSAVSVTGGPGLIGGVSVGVMTAKAIALVHRLPFLAMNHLAAHALTIRLTSEDTRLEFPYLTLLMSGGHTQLVICHSPLKYEVLGSTLDDALGECFDKVGKLMGLSYPAGPKIEEKSKKGDPYRFSLPKPLLSETTPESVCDFSFSGLKTAMRREIQQYAHLTEQTCADLCASFQRTVGAILGDRSRHALKKCQQKGLSLTGFVLSGGVAANLALREVLCQVADEFSLKGIAPPLSLCTDNAAMVAWAGLEKLSLGRQDTLEFQPRPRWPLTELEEGFPGKVF